MPTRSTKQKPMSTDQGAHRVQATEPGTHVFRDCLDTCNSTFAYCIQQGGKHVEPDHLRSLVDCMEICSVGADLVARSSPLAEKYMEVCAQACKECEESCEQFGDDPEMTACADACRACYEHCTSEGAPQVPGWDERRSGSAEGSWQEGRPRQGRRDSGRTSH